MLDNVQKFKDEHLNELLPPADRLVLKQEASQTPTSKRQVTTTKANYTLEESSIPMERTEVDQTLKARGMIDEQKTFALSSGSSVQEYLQAASNNKQLLQLATKATTELTSNNKHLLDKYEGLDRLQTAAFSSMR